MLAGKNTIYRRQGLLASANQSRSHRRRTRGAGTPTCSGTGDQSSSKQLRVPYKWWPADLVCGALRRAQLQCLRWFVPHRLW